MIRGKKIPNSELELFLLQIQHTILAQLSVRSVENGFFPSLQQFIVSSLPIPGSPSFFIGQRFPGFSAFSPLFSGLSPRSSHLRVQQPNFKHRVPDEALTYVASLGG